MVAAAHEVVGLVFGSVANTATTKKRQGDPSKSGSRFMGQVRILFRISFSVIPFCCSSAERPRKGYDPQISSCEQTPAAHTSALRPS